MMKQHLNSQAMCICPSSYVSHSPVRQVLLNYRLEEAIKKNNREEVLNAIREGANVNIRFGQGMTPLHYVVRDGNLDLARS